MLGCAEALALTEPAALPEAPGLLLPAAEAVSSKLLTELGLRTALELRTGLGLTEVEAVLVAEPEAEQEGYSM